MKKLIVFLVAPLVLSACAKGKNRNPITNIKQAANDTSLQGKVFESECLPERTNRGITALATGLQESIKASRVQYKAEGANITRRTLYFTTENCSGPVAFTFNEMGEMRIHDQKTSDGGRFIDINYNSVKVKIDSAQGAQIANALGMCRNKQWQAGEERDVTTVSQDLTCNNARVPRLSSNVYRVQNGILYLGTDTKSQVETTERPNSLDPDLQFKAR